MIAPEVPNAAERVLLLAISGMLLSVQSLQAQTPPAAAATPAQAPPFYGAVALLSVHHEGDPARVSDSLATLLGSLIRADKRMALVGDVESIAEDEMNAIAIAGIAKRKAVNRVALVTAHESPEKSGIGLIEVDVVSIDGIEMRKNRIASEPSGYGRSGLKWLGQLVFGKLLQLVSGGREVMITLTLTTSPGRAFFTVGKSEPDSTDKSGFALWANSVPTGSQPLHVFRPQCADRIDTLHVTADSTRFDKRISIRCGSTRAPVKPDRR